MKKQKKRILESPFGVNPAGIKTIDIDKMDAWFDYFIELDNLARKASKTKKPEILEMYGKVLVNIFRKYNAA